MSPDWNFKRGTILIVWSILIIAGFLCTAVSVSADTTINQCRELNVTDTYILNASVNSSGTCFTITVENVTLDCNNYTITYSIDGTAGAVGVYSNQFNSTIKNCNIFDGNWSSSYDDRYGILLETSDYSELSHNFVNVSSSTAIRVYNDANFNNLDSNIGSSNSSSGIYVGLNTDNNTLSNNRGYANVQSGLHLSSCESNILINNTGISSNEYFGIQLSSVDKSMLINNTGISLATSGFSAGLGLDSGSSGNTIISINATGGYYGIHFSDAHDNLFKDCKYVSGNGGGDVNNNYGLSQNMTFLNCSYATETIDGDASTYIVRQWYFDANITNSTGSPINAANVTVYNSTGSIIYSALTNSSGITDTIAVTEYVDVGGTITYSTPHNVTVTKSGYVANSTTYNISSLNNTFANLILSELPPLQCGNLSVANTIYNLTQNVTTTGTCFNITADNVTLDCKGYTITYSISGADYSYGVYAHQFNTTIKNCNILDGNFTSSSDIRDGILFLSCNYSKLYNNTVNVSESNALTLTGNTNFNNVTLNILSSISGSGLFLDYANNNTLKDNNATSNVSRGIYIYSSSNNLFANNRGTSNTNYGIALVMAPNNTLNYNVGFSNSSDGIYLGTVSNYNILTNNRGYSNEAIGIRFAAVNYNVIINNTGVSYGAGAGSELDSGSEGNILISNNFTGDIGLIVSGSISNLFKDCMQITGGGWDVYNNWAESTNDTFLNCSYGTEYVGGGATSHIVRQWYFEANITNSTGSPIDGANTTIYNSTGSLIFSALTNSSGNINKTQITEYVNTNGAKTFSTPHNMTITKSGFISNTTTYNISSTNNTIANLILNELPPPDCGNLSTANTIYTLTSNVTSEGTCFEINAINVTIDCQGYAIIFSTLGAQNTRGIESNGSNTIIKNCIVLDGNLTSVETGRHGIYFNGDDNSLLLNNFVNISGNESIAILISDGANFNNITNNTAIGKFGAGIILQTSSNYNVLTNNEGMSSESQGIGLYSSSNNILTGNIGTSDLNLGIYLDSSSNNSLRNNVGTAVVYMGIYLSSSSNNNLTDNNGTSNDSQGIALDLSSNNILSGNIGISNSNLGIFLESSSNNALTNNKGSSNSNYGLLLLSSTYNNLSDNTGISDEDTGLILSNSSDSILINNTGTSNSSRGIYLFTSSNNNLINNTGTSDTSYGIYLFSLSNNNTLTGNRGISGIGNGIRLESSTDNSLINNAVTSTNVGFFIYRSSNSSVIGNNATAAFAYHIQESNYTIISDCLFTSGTTNDVKVDQANFSIENKFINCSYNTSKELVNGTGNYIIRQWYFDANITNNSASPVDGANVTVYNSTGDAIYSALTNASGNINRTSITEYTNLGGTRAFSTPHNVTVTKSGFTQNTTTYNISSTNNTKANIILSETPVLQCGTLGIANTIYNLSSNVSSNGTCFMITADNVTLDCKGYWIIYSLNGSSDTYGVYTNKFNTTTRNCNVLDGNYTSGNTWRNGILYSLANGGRIENNFVNVSNGLAIYLYAGANNNILLNNTGAGVTGPGITLYMSSNNVLANNSGLSNSSAAIYITTASNNNSLTGNTGISTTGAGISVIVNSTNNTLTNNIGRSDTNYGLSIDSNSNYNNLINNTVASDDEKGIAVLSSSNNSLINNTAFSNTSMGIYLYYASNSTLTNNVGLSNSSIGIYVYSSYNDVLISNNGTSNSSMGVYVYNSSNNILMRNTGFSNSNIGIYLSSARNNNLSENNGTSISYYGIEIEASSNNNVVIGNIGASSSGSGLLMHTSSNNTLISNVGASSSNIGIYIYSSSNNILISNNGTTNNESGIQITLSSNNTLINNSGRSFSNSGIFMDSSTENVLTNNNGTSNASRGIFLVSSNNNILTSNRGTSNTMGGIQISTSYNNTLTNNVGTSTEDLGIYLYSSYNNSLIGNSVSGAYGYSFERTNYTIISDCGTTFASSSYEVYITSDNFSVENRFINCSYNTSKELVTGTGNNIIRQWYFDVNIINNSGSPVDGANVTLYNSTGAVIYSALTNTSGNINRTTISEYTNLGGTKAFSTPHNVTVTKSGYTQNTTTYNISSTKNTFANLTLSETPAQQCGSLATANAIYNLTSNVSSQGLCFIINAANVTLDCQGYSIIHSLNGSGAGYGIFSSQFNTTIKNCNIVDGNQSSNLTTRHGVFFIGNNRSTLMNNVVITNNSIGIVIYTDSNFNTLINNTAASNTNRGIFFYSSSNNTLVSNSGTSNSNEGIYIYNSSNNILTSNNGVSNSSYGLDIELSSNNNLTNNNGTSNSSFGIRLAAQAVNNTLTGNRGTSNSSIGIILSVVSNDTLISNIGVSTSDLGIYIYQSSNNNIISNNGSSTDGQGIYMEQSSNNTLNSNYGASNSSKGIILVQSSNNSLINNTGQSNSNYGLYLTSSSNNTLLNNTGISNSSYGILLVSADNNSIISNFGISNTSFGIYLYISSYNNLNSNNASGTYGYYLANSSYNQISDCAYTFGSNGYIKVEDNNFSYGNIVLNCSYNMSQEIVNGTSNYLIRQWYFEANITNSSASPVDGANVTVYNSTGAVIYSALTNASGNIDRTTITEYTNLGGTRAFSTPHNVTVIKSGYTQNTTTYNISTTNNTIANIVLSETSEQQCGTLAIANTIYNLTSNVSSQGTCFTISAQNVTLDCQGNWITYSINGNAYTYGIYSDKFNTTIMNCNVIDGNISSVNDTRHAIMFYNSGGGILDNNTVNVSYGRAISFFNSSNQIIINNKAISQTNFGIRIYASLNATLINNTGTSGANVGIYIELSNNNTLINNEGSSNMAYGICLELSSNNFLTNNNGSSNSSRGTQFTALNNSILIGNIGTSNSDFGIRVFNSTNNNLTNNIGISNSSSGIALYAALNNTFTNNTGRSNLNSGIYLELSSNNILISNNGISNLSAGIQLDSSSNNNLTGNNGTSNTSIGIYLETSSNNNILINNAGTSISAYGIILTASSNNNTLLSNNGTSITNYGIYIYNSTNNNLTANTGTSNTSQGIVLGNSFNNLLINNIGISNTNIGIFLYQSANNNTLTANNATGYYGYFVRNSSNNNIQDCLYTYGTDYDVYVNADNYSTENKFINCTYNISKEIVNGGFNYIVRYWYFEVNITNSSGNPIANANITMYNSSGDMIYSALTNSSGNINKTIISEYTNLGGTRAFSTPHNVTVTKSGFTSNTTTYNISSTNNTNANIILSETSAQQCGTLETANMIYNLTSNVSSQGTCFIVTADNVTLDCNGYTINYSIDGTDTKYGVYTSKLNTTIKNCNIIDGNWTSNNTWRNGIYIDTTTNCKIENNTINISYGRGILLELSTNNLVINNIVTSNTNRGIQLTTSSNNNITNNNVTSNTDYGIYLTTSNNNSVTNNHGIGNSLYGLFLYSSSNNSLISNTGTSNTSQGIRIEESSNNTLINNTGRSNSSYGIYLGISNNNILINNEGMSNSSAGIYVESSSNNNLTQNTGGSLLGRGISLTSSPNNILSSNNGYSNNSYGIIIDFASNNTLINNIGTSNASYGLCLASYSNNNTLTGNRGISNISRGIVLSSASNNLLINNTGLSNIEYGIQLTASHNNNVTSNNGTSISGYGIYLYNSSNNTFATNIGTSNSSYGIVFGTTANNNTATNNTGTSKSGTGFYIYLSSNNTLANNIGISNSSRGIYLLSSLYNVLINNTGISNSSHGIRLDISSNNMLTNNTGTSSGNANGIYLYNLSNNNILEGNHGLSNSSQGIYVTLSNNNVLTSNIGTSNASQGIRIQSSTGNNLTSNIGASDANYGILLSTSSNSLLINNTGTSNNSIGIFVYISSNNSLAGNNATGVYGYYIQESNYTTISDCRFTSGSSFDVQIDPTDFSLENTFLNCTYDSENVAGANNYILRKWYFVANITNSTGNPVDGANVTVFNSTGAVIYSALTNTSGNINKTTITEYTNLGGTKSFSTPHNVTVTKSGYTQNITSYNISSTNNTNANIVLSETQSLQCGTLGISNTIYNLTSNVSSQGTCFTISAENVTLDCKGYSITYAVGGENGVYGVYAEKYNITVKNCIILDGNLSSNETWKHGIYFSGNNNSKLLNNIINISGNNSIGILLNSGAFNEIINNTIESQKYIGLLIQSSSNNNTLINNTVISNLSVAIFILSSNNNTIINNTGSSNNSYGIYVSSADYNIITNNTGISNASFGLYLLSSSSNILTDNIGASNAAMGIYLQNSSNNILIRNTGNSSLNTGIELYSSTNNTFTANNAIGAYAYYFSYTNYTMISDCVQTSGSVTDVQISSNNYSIGNTFINCSYNLGKELIAGEGNYILRQWYFEANITNSSGSPVDGANVTVYNSTGVLIYSALTNTSGNINRTVITEYTNLGGTRAYSTPHNVTVTKSGYTSNTTTYNISSTNNTNANIILLNTPQDLISPAINIENPTPEDSEAINGTNVTIIANITDESNTSTWIDMDRSIVGYWSMDFYNQSGVYDNSTYANFGTFTGSINTSNIVTGSRGQGLEFNGNAGINCRNASNLQLVRSGTISIWVYPTNLTEYKVFISKGNFAGDINGYLLSTDGGNVAQISLANETTSIYHSNTNKLLTINAWNHIVGTWDLNNGSIALYVDGVVQEGNNTLVPVTNVYNLTIGRDNVYAPAGFIGMMDEIMIFNRSLSQSEVLALYNSKINKFNATFTNLSTGQHNYTIYSVDAAGNRNSSGLRSFIVNTTAPSLQCGTLSTPNTIYNLTSNVSSNGTCFTISASNVTLDCQGYTITYSINGSANTRGIYSNQFNATIKNCNILDGNWTSNDSSRSGIYVSGIKVNIFNNTVNASSSEAIYVDTSTNSTLISNTGFSSSNRGILISNSNNCVITNNIGIANEDGIALLYGAGHNFTNNSGKSIVDAGIWIVSNASLFINNTGTSNESSGFILQGGFNTLINNTGISYNTLGWAGLALVGDCSGNVIQRGNFTGRFGISLGGSNNNVFRDCIFVNGSAKDVYNNYGVSTNDTFLNCTYDEDSVLGGDTSYIVRKWYFSVNVTNSSGNPLNGSNVTIYNKTGGVVYSALTNASGDINSTILTEYVNLNGTILYSTPHNVIVTKSGYTSNSTTYNLSSTNNTFASIILSEDTSLQCGNLSVANTIYNLTSNVTSAGTCFNITANNVTLDCQNNWITYSTSGLNDTFGVYSDRINVTIKNCNILDGNWSSNKTARYGIYGYSVDNSTFYNNFVNTNISITVYIVSSAQFNNISSNIFVSNSASSTVYINWGIISDNWLINNTISAMSGSAVDGGGLRFKVISNNITSNGQGLFLNGIESSEVINNTIVSQENSLYIGGSGNNISGNRVTNNASGSAIVLAYSGATNNILTSNIATSGDGSAMVFWSSANNNLFVNNSVTSIADGSGISISNNCNNNTLINNNASSVTGEGIYIWQSANNTLISNNASGGKGYSISDSNYTSISDCRYTAGSVNDVVLTGTSIANIFTNCSYNKSKESIAAGSEMTRQWYFEVNITNSSIGPINGSNVTIYNSTGSAIYSALTNSSGNINRITITEYTNLGGTRAFSTPHNVTVTKSGYTSNTTIYNLSSTTNTKADIVLIVESGLNISFGPDTFISVWNTSLNSSGSTNVTQIGLPLESSGTYNFTVYWGDGTSNTITTWNDANINHSYASAGIYQINITGTVVGWKFNNAGDRLKILNITQWGNLRLGNNNAYFAGASNLKISATDILNLSGTTSLWSAFEGCANLTTVPNMNNWDVSQVTSMREMFIGATLFNENISSWNTSKVNHMYAMFWNAISFNQSIGSWDTGNVLSMARMFSSADNFTQDISSWDTKNVTEMSLMFYYNQKFNSPIGNWNTSKVTDMTGMFGWNPVFNQNISGWDTGKVTSMEYMFTHTPSFNQNISSWNTSNVKNMGDMFNGATSFNQNIGVWDIHNVTSMFNMLNGVRLSVSNYDSLLNGWSSQTVNNNINFTAGNSKYSINSLAGKIILNTTHNWNITDGGFMPNPNISFANSTTAAGSQSQNFIVANVSASSTVNITNMTIYLYNSTNLIAANSSNASFFWNITNLAYENYYLNATIVDSEGLTNKTETINISLTAPPLQCSTLSTANTMYNLTSNVSSNGTCFTVTADNVTLDCQGNTITYSLLGLANSYGVYSDKFNTTVKNCRIVDGNYSSSITTRYGIRYFTENSGLLQNITISVNNSYGIILDASSNNSIFNINSFSGSQSGILIVSGSNNNIVSGLNGSTTSGNGIYLYDSSNNFISNSIGSSNTSYGIALQYGSKNNISHSSGTSSSNYGIYSENSNNNTFTGVIGASNVSFGMRFYNSSYTTMSNTSGYSNSSWGVYIQYGSNIRLFNVTGTSNSSGGIQIDSSWNNNLTAITGISNTNIGIYFNNISGSTLTDSNGFSDGETGIRIYSSSNNVLMNNSGISNTYKGIYLSSDSNNTLIGNIGISNSDQGIILYAASNNNILTNNTGRSNTGMGLYIYNSTGNILNNNNGTSNTSFGIYLSISSNTTMIGNLGTSLANDGISLIYSSNNTLTNNTGISNVSHGLCISTSSNNNTLTSNTGRSNSSIGINVASNTNNMFVNNTGASIAGMGIYFDNSSNNVLINNSATSNASMAIALVSSSNNNTLSGNRGASNLDAGIQLSSSSNNNLVSNTGISNLSSGIILYSASNNNTLINNNGTSNASRGIRVYLSSYNNLSGNNATGDYGYEIYVSNYTTIADCVITSGVSYDLYVHPTEYSIENTIINCSYNISKESVNGAGNYIIRKWYFEANITNASTSSVSGANITLYNISGALIYSALTNASGSTNRTIITEYINIGGTRTFSTPHTVNVTKSGYYSNTTTYNISSTQNTKANIIISQIPLPVQLSINFTSPTDAAGSLNRNYIMINATALGENITNITLNIYNISVNSSELINSSIYYSASAYINYTVPRDGIYSFNATVYNLSGNFVSTETRNVSIDTSIPPQEDEHVHRNSGSSGGSYRVIIPNSTNNYTNNTSGNLTYVNNRTLNNSAINASNNDSVSPDKKSDDESAEEKPASSEISEKETSKQTEKAAEISERLGLGKDLNNTRLSFKDKVVSNIPEFFEGIWTEIKNIGTFTQNSNIPASIQVMIIFGVLLLVAGILSSAIIYRKELKSKSRKVLASGKNKVSKLSNHVSRNIFSRKIKPKSKIHIEKVDELLLKGELLRCEYALDNGKMDEAKECYTEARTIYLSKEVSDDLRREVYEKLIELYKRFNEK
jgi:surface protein/parallel beta-helix repeat protein